MGNTVAACCGDESRKKRYAFEAAEPDEDDVLRQKALLREEKILLAAQCKAAHMAQGASYEHSRESSIRKWRSATSEVIKHLRQRRHQERKTITSVPIEELLFWSCPSHDKTEEDKVCIRAALDDSFVAFDMMDEVAREKVVMAMERAEFDYGSTLEKQGAIGKFFHIVALGRVVFVDEHGKERGVLGRGSAFGECALLYNSTVPLTARAVTNVVVWKVTQKVFRTLLATIDQDDGEQVQTTLENVPFLKDLSADRKFKLASALVPIRFDAGDRIVNKGDEGRVFYVVKEGEVRVHDIGHGQSNFEDQILGPGRFFGERSLLTGETRAANVTAVGGSGDKKHCCLLAISREMFEEIIGPLDKALGEHFGFNPSYLKAIPVLSGLTFSEVEQLCKLGKKIQVRATEKVDCRNLYVVESGRILLSYKRGSLFKLMCGDYFGEPAKADEDSFRQNATVEEDATLFALNRADILSVVGDLSRLGLDRRHSSDSETKTIKFTDLQKHWILGMGSFGKVWLVTNKKDGAPYALKVVSKRELLSSELTDSASREKAILASINHPFIMDMITSYKDADYLYFLFGLIRGGELFDLMHQNGEIKGEGSPLRVEDARFYTACIVEALDYLHTRHVAYRDIKPENILVDNDGYCILVDLGFAKFVVDKTYTMCGTPEYIAPEVIVSKGHNWAADYWGLGCLLYELITGCRTPFFEPGENIDDLTLFRRIVKAEYRFPTGERTFPESCEDLIRRLLIPKNTKRLGNLADGIHGIKNHPWFDGIDFADLIQKKVKAPYVPELNDPMDPSNNNGKHEHEEKDEYFFCALSENEQNYFKDF